MRPLVVFGGALLIGACSFGALNGFSGDTVPESDAGPTSDGGPNPTGDSSPIIDSTAPGFDAPTTSAYHAAVAADAPVAHFALEETTGPSCASSTATSAVCVYPQGNATRDKPGVGGTKALHFDTNMAKLTISGLSGDMSLPFTFELWARLDNTVTGMGIGYFQNPGMGHPGSGFNLFVWDNDRLRSEFWNADSNIGYGATPTALTANVWHHIVIEHTVAPVDFLFYVDAQLVEHFADVDASVGPNVTTPYTLTGFVGSIDEIAVYDKPLSAARIAAHYAAQ